MPDRRVLSHLEGAWHSGIPCVFQEYHFRRSQVLLLMGELDKSFSQNGISFGIVGYNWMHNQQYDTVFWGVSKNHQITRRKNKHDDVEQDLQKPMEVSGFIQKGLPFSGYFKGKRNTSQLRFLDRRKHEENPWRSSKFGHRTRAENQ